MKRDFVSIEDFSNDEIEVLFVIADKMQSLLRQCHGVLAGHIMGSLFLEPSTRTRLSFEAAMNRLGGKSNTGEGGEDKDRLYDPSRRSAIIRANSSRALTRYAASAWSRCTPCCALTSSCSGLA